MSKPSEPETGAAIAEAIPVCPHCQKPLPLCVCDSITPIQSRISLLILQHPQEQDRALGTARLTALHFKDAVLKIGLSWPSLSKALGRPVDDPSRWAVLYLGSAKVADLDTDSEIVAINRKGEAEEHQRGILRDIEGIVLLDGTWSQAKALSAIEKRPDIAETLHASFERMLAKYREAQTVLPELAPKPRPKRDYRRRKRA
jgi:DTW domain-containing protein YfiP